jgi:hypothetical protein
MRVQPTADTAHLVVEYCPALGGQGETGAECCLPGEIVLAWSPNVDEVGERELSRVGAASAMRSVALCY